MITSNCIERSDIPLKEHQIRVIKKLLEPGRHGIAAIHATGSGKTLLSVAASQCFLDANPSRKVIVVSPCTLKDNFKKEILKYKNFRNYDSYMYYTTDKFHKDFSANPEIVGNDTMLIIDEAHLYRTEIKKSGNNKVIKGVRSYSILDASKLASKVLLMTATPMVNTISDFINIIGMIDGSSGSEIPDYKTFVEIVKRPAALKEYFAGKLDFYEPDKEEYEAHFPRIEYENVFFRMSDSLYKIYRRQEEMLGYNSKKNEELGEDIFNKDMTRFYTGIRMTSNLSDEASENEEMKIKWVVDKVKETYLQNKRWIIFSQFIKFGISDISNKLTAQGIKHEYITGEVTDLCKRYQSIVDYNSGKSDILLISSCAATGIDTVNTDYVVSLEHPWNYAVQKQVVGRAVRYDSHKNHPTKVVKVFKLYTVKPNEFDYGPEIIMKMPGKENPWNELKSSDLLLMSYSDRKSAAIDTLFNSAKTFNAELEANNNIMRSRAESAINVLSDYLFNPQVPFSFKSLNPITEDTTIISIPLDWRFIVKLPIIKFPCKPTSSVIDQDLGEYSVIGEYHEGEYIISVITEYSNEDGLILMSDIIDIIGMLCSRDISKALPNIRNSFFSSTVFVGLLSLLADLPNNKVCSFLSKFMENGCNINKWRFKIKADKSIEFIGDYELYDGYLILTKSGLVLTNKNSLGSIIDNSFTYLNSVNLKTKNIECLTKELPGYVYKLL